MNFDTSVYEDAKVEEYNALSDWLDQFTLSRTKKRIHRDFSDAVLLAEIIKYHYPKLVELHNYTSRFSFQTKLENWRTLNRRVLKKLNLTLTEKTLINLSKAMPGVIDQVLLDLKVKITTDEKLRLEALNTDKVSSDGSWYDVGAIDGNSDTMIVPIRRRDGDAVKIFTRKVITFDNYVSLQNQMCEKMECIEILKQKVNHLENLIRTKDFHISELQKKMQQKTLKIKKNNEMLLMDSARRVNCGDFNKNMITMETINNDML